MCFGTTGPGFHCETVCIAFNFTDFCKSSHLNARKPCTHLQLCLVNFSQSLYRQSLTLGQTGPNTASDRPTSTLINTPGKISLPLSTRQRAPSAVAASLAGTQTDFNEMKLKACKDDGPLAQPKRTSATSAAPVMSTLTALILRLLRQVMVILLR